MASIPAGTDLAALRAAVIKSMARIERQADAFAENLPAGCNYDAVRRNFYKYVETLPGPESEALRTMILRKMFAAAVPEYEKLGSSVGERILPPSEIARDVVLVTSWDLYKDNDDLKEDLDDPRYSDGLFKKLECIKNVYDAKNFKEKLFRVIEEKGYNPNKTVVQLSTSMFAPDDAKAQECLKEIVAKGIRYVLIDTGDAVTQKGHIKFDRARKELRRNIYSRMLVVRAIKKDEPGFDDMRRFLAFDIAQHVGGDMAASAIDEYIDALAGDDPLANLPKLNLILRYRPIERVKMDGVNAIHEALISA